MRAVLVAVLAAGTVAATPGAASPIAEVLCEPTPEMLTRLEARMNHSRAAIGMRDEEQLLEVWKDEKGGWVLVASYASGTSCILAMGQHWQTLDPQEPA